MENKHEEIEALIKQKLIQLKELPEADAEKKKFYAVYKMISDKEQYLFERISIETAKAILLSLGISEEEWFENYIALREEENNRRYTLIDTDQDYDEDER